MTIKIVHSLNKECWHDFVCQHSQGGIFHTPEMFEVFQQARGSDPLVRAAVNQDGQVLALFLPVQLSLMAGPLRPLTTRLISYGGVLCAEGPAGTQALSILLEAVNREMRRKALFIEMRNYVDMANLQPVLLQSAYVFQDHLNYLIDLNSFSRGRFQPHRFAYAETYPPRIEKRGHPH